MHVLFFKDIYVHEIGQCIDKMLTSGKLNLCHLLVKVMPKFSMNQVGSNFLISCMLGRSI